MGEQRRPPARKTWSEFYEEPLELQRMLSWGATHAPMLEELDEARRVLEVGTGTAALAGLLSLLGKETVSVDLDIAVQRVAGINVGRLRGRVAFVGGDAFRLPFGDGAFDAAFSQGFFEHFDDGHVQLLLAEQLRVARKVVFSVPNRRYPHLGRRGPGLIGNERLLTADRWRGIVSPLAPRIIEYRDPKALNVAGVALGPRMHTLVVIEA